MNSKKLLKDYFQMKHNWYLYWEGNAILFKHNKEPKGHSLFLNIGGFGGKPVEIKFFVWNETWKERLEGNLIKILKSEFPIPMKFPNQQATKEGYKLISLIKYSFDADALTTQIDEVYKRDWEKFTNRIIELLNQ